MAWVFGQAQGARSGPLLWSGGLSISSTATPHRFIQIYNIHIFIYFIELEGYVPSSHIHKSLHKHSVFDNIREKHLIRIKLEVIQSSNDRPTKEVK